MGFMNSMIAYHVIQDVKQDGKRSTEIIEKFDNSYTCEEIINILRKMNVRKVYDYGYIPNYTRTDLTDALHDNLGLYKSRKRSNCLQKLSLSLSFYQIQCYYF
jgi:hypothetical protein